MKNPLDWQIADFVTIAPCDNEIAPWMKNHEALITSPYINSMISL
jgi:hypothetical protein